MKKVCSARRPDPRRPHESGSECRVCYEPSTVYAEIGAENSTSGFVLCDSCARSLGSQLLALVGGGRVVTADMIYELFKDSYELRRLIREIVRETE